MIAKLEFHLPDQRREHQDALNGSKYRCMVYKLDLWLKAMEKKDKDAIICASEVRKKLVELMSEQGVD